MLLIELFPDKFVTDPSGLEEEASATDYCDSSEFCSDGSSTGCSGKKGRFTVYVLEAKPAPTKLEYTATITVRRSTIKRERFVVIDFNAIFFPAQDTNDPRLTEVTFSGFDFGEPATSLSIKVYSLANGDSEEPVPFHSDPKINTETDALEHKIKGFNIGKNRVTRKK